MHDGLGPAVRPDADRHPSNVRSGRDSVGGQPVDGARDRVPLDVERAAVVVDDERPGRLEAAVDE